MNDYGDEYDDEDEYGEEEDVGPGMIHQENIFN
jgi:hypothetical protein